jgi:galactokinase
MVDLQKLRDAFAELSAKEPRFFSAPGRVNLIGEHTDYNEGFVLPLAANLRTFVAAALRDDGQVRVHSIDLNETASFSLATLESILETESRSWLTYIEGMTQTLTAAGLNFGGADLALVSEVPIGAGLSSSAALEISVGFALTKIAGLNIGLMDLALAAQETEHCFVGTKSGLMDQLTAAFAEEEHAMFIDCRSNQITQIPMKLPTAVAICDTRVKHTLAASAYNERRRECENAVRLIRRKKPEVMALRDLSVTDLQIIEELPEPERRRARHVVTENHRTLLAAQALEANDAGLVGKLMTQSHASLRDDFEVSCRELDIMFDLAESQPGVSGARMMGGGFGGCTINLVDRGELKNFTDRMTEGYEQATGLTPIIYVIEPDAGVRELFAEQSQLPG